ncbi:MAG: hypothetical protein MUF48_10975 [Pirellulaceae bacterium]|jgi:hypothetical protein|nr:hypothetical protein [Pirellulaceae bacterium]
MNQLPLMSGCACCGWDRRRFLAAGCAACAGAAGLALSAQPARAASRADKTRIRILYSLHAPKQDRPDWPNVGFDFGPVMQRVESQLRQHCGDCTFVSSMAADEERAKAIVAEDGADGVDGYLVLQLNCWNRVVQAAAATGKPVLYADFQYGGSGGFLVYTSAFLRSGAPNVGFVASSRMEDLIEAVKCFDVVKRGGSVQDFVAATQKLRHDRTAAPDAEACRDDAVATLSPEECLRRMKECRILTVEQGWPSIDAQVTELMGIEVIKVPFAELNAAWEAADKDQSRALADTWEKTAQNIRAVSRGTLEISAAMYLAEKAVLERHRANAITINCLGGFYGNHIHAYPCLGFHELLNEGLIGACECDLRSTATMVAMTTLTQGRPGYISDPVIDTAKRQIIYAHCVASNRVFGPQGTANPYEILTHSEDRQGASVRSTMPVGYMTTTVEFAPERKVILFHQGKSVENSLDDRACRTKLAVQPVGDLEKLFTQWDQWGWHRVTYFGDLKEPVFALADALGWDVLQEA